MHEAEADRGTDSIWCTICPTIHESNIEIEMDQRQAVAMEDDAKEMEMSLCDEVRTDRTLSVQAVAAAIMISTIVFTRIDLPYSRMHSRGVDLL